MALTCEYLQLQSQCVSACVDEAEAVTQLAERLLQSSGRLESELAATAELEQQVKVSKETLHKLEQLAHSLLQH